jgi:hypothetical protein
MLLCYKERVPKCVGDRLQRADGWIETSVVDLPQVCSTSQERNFLASDPNCMAERWGISQQLFHRNFAPERHKAD